MPDLVVDFSDVQEFKPVPIGWYDMEVAETRIGTSQAGNPKVTFVLSIVGGDHEGRKLIDDLVLVGKGLWRTKQAFNAFLGEVEGKVTFNPDDFVGETAQVRVIHRVWREEDGGDGAVRSRPQNYRPASPDESLAGMFDEEDPFTPPAPQVQEDIPF